MKDKLLLMLFMFVCSAQQLMAQQHTVSGKVQNETGKPLYNVAVFFMVQDTLVAGTTSNENGEFQIKELPDNEYLIQYSLMGYKAKQQRVKIKNNSRLETISLEEDPIALKEVEVNADRSGVVKMEAGKMTFFISDEMKKKASTVYEALTEVPILQSNPVERKIQMADGSGVEILINGVKRNINLVILDPQKIEAVEVIDNPSARYRGNYGDIKILNLKVKRSTNLWTVDLYGRQELYGKYGVYGPAFGMEKEKFSFSLSAQDWYSRNKKTESDNWTYTDNMERYMSGVSKSKQNSLYISGDGDWVISDKDYLSFGATFITNPSESVSSEEGFVSLAGERSPLSIHSESKGTYITGNYNVFYRRTFSPSNHYELTAKFGHHDAGPEGWREEKSDFYAYRNRIDMDNVKQYAQVEMNYDFTVLDKLAANVGANTYFQNISLRDLDGKFPYKETREYIYGDIRNKNQSRFSYMVSVGLDMVFRNSGYVKHNYVNFLPSLSLSYKIHEKGSIRLNASRNRVSPSIERMNPRPTTTDSFNVSVGNPYLKPTISNVFNLSYALTTKWLFLMPNLTYVYNQDNVIPVGELDGDIYRHTYMNGSYSQYFNAGVTFGFQFGKIGNLSLTPRFTKNMYEGGSSYSGNTWGIQAFTYLKYKNVYFMGNMNYSRYGYSRTSRSTSSPMVEMMLGWKLPKNWEVNISIRDNSKSSKTWNKDGLYHSYGEFYCKDNSWTPMVGFSYTFRNRKDVNRRQKTYKKGNDIEGFGINVK